MVLGKRIFLAFGALGGASHAFSLPRSEPTLPAHAASTADGALDFQQVHRDITADRSVPSSQGWLSPLSLGIALGLTVAIVGGAQPASAEYDLTAWRLGRGATIFGANNSCTACHYGGGNVISPEKTLKKDALIANSRYEIDQMVQWITNGGAGMPAWGNRLGKDDILDVAMFVRSQADKGW
eukprot:TRINITY_DN12815_c0_g1_i2.p1 TRINITY_DN12815_c0_g1~~TRINITY_DN12815_c0_g1_i2.p1  ORF type:complete len:182 (-),score=37.99 TRINITY_DN12815_c0_g1_i2:132-677(-)